MGRRRPDSSSASAASTWASAGRRGQVGGQHRERPLLPVLARPQRRHRRLVGGVAGQVVAAEALDRHDRARPQQAGRDRQRVTVHPGPVEAEPGTAGRAAHRLRVEPPIAGIAVLPGAVGAHREPGHRREWTVVRDAGHHGEARAAVGAVDERVAVPAVGRVGQLGQAVGAGRGVRGDRRPLPAGRGTGHDGEPGDAGGRQRDAGDLLDHREHRRPVPQRGHEGVHRAGRALRLGDHTVRVVADVPGHPELGGQRVHERPVADPLDDPPDPDPDPGQRADWVSSQSTWYAVVWASWIRCTDEDGTTKRWSIVPAAAIRPPS